MSTLTAALRRSARLYGNEPAVHDGDRSWSWSEFCERVARAAAVLQSLGVADGDRFAIVALNSSRQAELVYAGYWCGATPVPINIRLAPPEMQTIVKDAGCGLIALDPSLLHLLGTPDLAAWNERCLMISTDETSGSGVAEYESLLVKTDPAPPFDAAETDEALLLYTGGTSGKPKGVPLSHRNILANAMQIALSWPARKTDVALHVAPMFHSAELVLMTPFMLQGAAHAYLPRFTPEALFHAIEDHAVTVTLLVPTMLMMAIDSGIAHRFDLSSLERIIYGASRMSAEWIQRTMKCFPGVEIVQGYGLTETAPLLAILDFESHVAALERHDEERLGSCGRPLAGVDLRIVDGGGVELPVGEAGEIVVRGPNVFGGYLRLRKLSREALAGGWFHTGDVGKVDAEGYLYVLDRKKDMIISGAENVYSGEVEAVLSQHTGVAEVAVIGVPDERYGESVFAVVVPAEGAAPTSEALIEHCHGKIGDFKIPRAVAIVEQMPKSALGKILKTELRRTYGGA